MSATIRFTGGAELARNLDALSTRLSRQIQRQALKEAGEPIRQMMAQRAPIEPGAPDLAANIVISTARPKGWGSTVVAIAIGPAKDFFYGFFQEYGTVHHRAQPFVRPAYDQQVVSGRTLNQIKEFLWRALISRGFAGTRGSGGGVGD
jgi:HK97 gp10 family phage protein